MVTTVGCAVTEIQYLGGPLCIDSGFLVPTNKDKNAPSEDETSTLRITPALYDARFGSTLGVLQSAETDTSGYVFWVLEIGTFASPRGSKVGVQGVSTVAESLSFSLHTDERWSSRITRTTYRVRCARRSTSDKHFGYSPVAKLLVPYRSLAYLSGPRPSCWKNTSQSLSRMRWQSVLSSLAPLL